jgi:hypothetical protein
MATRNARLEDHGTAVAFPPFDGVAAGAAGREACPKLRGPGA